MKAKEKQRIAYISSVLKIPALKGRLNYAVYRQTTDYLSSTVIATASAINKNVRGDYKVLVFVDGLRKSQTQWFGKELRHLRVKTEKVRGVRKEESDALMRLADAVAGFVRAAISGQDEMARLLKKAKDEEYIREL